eukprot:gene64776-88610_t
MFTFATAGFSLSRAARSSLISKLRLSTMNNALKKIPYGISSFNQMVGENFLFFDRTQAIEKLENSGSFLKIWRPRRSGKSMFCSQLALYYDTGVVTKVFDNTYIGKNPTLNKSKYLVLFLSFSNIDIAGNLRDNFKDYINSKNHLNSIENLFNVVRRAKEEVYLIVD